MVATEVLTLRSFLLERLDEATRDPEVSLTETECTRQIVLCARNPETLQVLALPYRSHRRYPRPV